MVEWGILSYGIVMVWSGYVMVMYGTVMVRSDYVMVMQGNVLCSKGIVR